MSNINKICILIFFGNFLMCQELQNINSKISDIQPSKRTYISDELGNLFININVWGIENQVYTQFLRVQQLLMFYQLLEE